MGSFWSEAKETMAGLHETAVEEFKNAIEAVRDTWPTSLEQVPTPKRCHI